MTYNDPKALAVEAEAQKRHRMDCDLSRVTGLPPWGLENWREQVRSERSVPGPGTMEEQP